jgi:D-amino-acid dehydrogenase
MRTDTIVLGAGIIGVCVALHLQLKGRDVVMIDRKAPGSETSFGNAGLIERSSVVPYAFPRQVSAMMRFGFNRSSAVRYDLLHLVKLAPWLARYWWHSEPARLLSVVEAMRPLIERSVVEHDLLAAAAGVESLIKADGWIETFRTQAIQDKASRMAEKNRPYGLKYTILDQRALRTLEAGLLGAPIGGIHWHDPKTVTDPGGLVKAYADLFVRNGGRIVTGDARSLSPSGDGWAVKTEDGAVLARDAVVTLGPWADQLLVPLGYRIPLAVKRGYHMHYALDTRHTLNHSLVDEHGGYVLAPMTRGVRLATGVEFAAPGAPPKETQLRRAEKIARTVLPLGRRLDATPWLGLRPCLPDMKPVIGPAPRHKNLGFAFGHAHHGLTLGPVTGRLLAEMVTGETPFTDPTPYSAQRFG